MRGHELDRARQVLRTTLRRELLPTIRAETRALDRAQLLALSADTGTAAGIGLRRALTLKALAAMGYFDTETAEAFRLTGEQVRALIDSTLLMDPAITEAIEARVVLEIPETPEPGRYVLPAS